MNVFQFSITCKRTNNVNNATYYVKLGKKRRESSKRNYYIVSPRVIIKAIIIEDEDDGRNPVYATRSSVHGVKQLMLIGDDDRSNLSHLAPKINKLKSLASLIEQGLYANKTVLLGIGY